jgi:serine phosphatase RsbU (regulator of sigma subunit)/pSer/pThr/pTyr-binding forkhead associated (FHA) protein
MPDLQILAPDGTSRVVPLEAGSITLGRAATAPLSYPDDAGLSRQHLVLEQNAETRAWQVRDLGSKNGTSVNGAKIGGPTALQPGDRITAGHLILMFEPFRPSTESVVVFETTEAPVSEGATVITNLKGLLKAEKASFAGAQSGSPAAAGTFADRQIAALVRAGNELSGHRPLPELFKFILDLAIQTVSADRGVLVTVESSGLVPQANRGEGFRISSLVRDRTLAGESILIQDTSLDSALRARESIVGQQIRTLMAVPLQTQDTIIGFIYVDSPSLLRQFSRDDLNVLTVMANVAAVRIEQVRFAEVEQARRLMARDLDQAAEIQQQYLPAGAPQVEGLDIAGFNAPCRTVGGDYYDFFPYPNHHVGLVLGDVSGKGMPASLLMMGLQARVQVMAEEPRDLAHVMTRLNRFTSAKCPVGRFITLFFAIVDGQSGAITCVNAGHNPPLLVRTDGTWKELKIPNSGPVIGIVPDFDYTTASAQLDSGDVMVIFSDGVTEAANVNGQDFDVQRLGAAVAANRSRPAQEIVQAVMESLAEFTTGAAQYDDITLIVTRRL